MDIGYSGLAASLYDLWWWGKPIGDEAFYQRRMKQFPGPALEVGCGTGRLLIPYLQAGFDVEGVDCAPEMLSQCQQKAEHVGLTPILYKQFMQELALPRRYRTIYIPFRSFQLLSKREDALEALQRFHAHLEPEGQLLISIGMPWDGLADTIQGQLKLLQTTTRPDDGATVLCLGTTTLDRFEQVQTHWNRYEIYKLGQLVETQIKMSQSRWYFKYEFMLMLEKVGFHNISTYGDYADAEASEHHANIVFSARKSLVVECCTIISFNFHRAFHLSQLLLEHSLLHCTRIAATTGSQSLRCVSDKPLPSQGISPLSVHNHHPPLSSVSDSMKLLHLSKIP